MNYKPKAVKITWLGSSLREVYPHATRWQVLKYRVGRAVRWVVIRCAIGVTGTILVVAGYAYAQMETPVLVASNPPVQEMKRAVVMERIAKAESGDVHWGKNGQVIMGVNKNGTVDVGRYQINTAVWGAKATELGWNLMDEKDNEAMAFWIFDNFGSEPWYSSKKNW